jgi:hypothetical protein
MLVVATVKRDEAVKGVPFNPPVGRGGPASLCKGKSAVLP